MALLGKPSGFSPVRAPVALGCDLCLSLCGVALGLAPRLVLCLFPFSLAKGVGDIQELAQETLEDTELRWGGACGDIAVQVGWRILPQWDLPEGRHISSDPWKGVCGLCLCGYECVAKVVIRV